LWDEPSLLISGYLEGGGGVFLGVIDGGIKLSTHPVSYHGEE